MKFDLRDDLTAGLEPIIREAAAALGLAVTELSAPGVFYVEATGLDALRLGERTSADPRWRAWVAAFEKRAPR